jgi:predicted O-methyltransferase YrrM
MEERRCLARHAKGKQALVEIGVYEGATTALFRSVMHPDGAVTGIDPHPPGRLGVSFERWIALREIEQHRRGRAVLLRAFSHEAARTWHQPIDFLFLDGDHSWAAIECDWTDWSSLVVAGGVIALHDSRSVPARPDLGSVAYTEQVILSDPRFELLEQVQSLTVLQRRPRIGG